MYEVLNQIADALKVLSSDGYTIYTANHLKIDSLFEYVLDGKGIPYCSHDLQYKTPSKVYEFYRSMELTIGMRGHAQMIPFGLNSKILSIGTHDKLRYFLEDINALEWYIDVKDDDFQAEKVISTARKILDNSLLIEEKISHEQKRLFEITMDNFKRIKALRGI